MSDAAKLLLERRFPARPQELRAVRDALRQALEKCGAGERCRMDVVMAVDEACQNIIRHAYRGDPEGEIVLRVTREGNRLEFCLRDFAPPVDPARIKPRQPLCGPQGALVPLDEIVVDEH